jgi:small-conductance mechanosensitive channel
MRHGGNLTGQAGTTRRWFLGTVMLMLLAASRLAGAQSEAGTDQANLQAVPPAPPVIEPILATDIPARADTSQSALRGYRGRIGPSAEVGQAIGQIDGAEAEIEASAREFLVKDAGELPVRTLQNLQLQWTNTRSTLEGWQNVLSRQSGILNQARADLAALVSPWRKTREQWDEVDLPAALRDQVTSVLKNAEEVDQQLKERLDEILTHQSRVSLLTNAADEVLGRIRQADTLQRQRLLKVDAEPLLTAIFGKRDRDEERTEATDDDPLDAAAEQLETEVSTPVASAWSSVRKYLAANVDRVAAHFVLFLLLTVLLFYTRAQLHTWYKEDEEPSADTLNLFTYPVATAAFIALLFSRAMYPAAPLELIQLNRGLLALPLLALLTAALDKRRRIGAYALIAVYVIDSITDSVAAAPLGGRLLQLLVATLGLLTLVRAEFGTRSSVSGMRRTWHLASRLVIRAAAVALIVAIIANFAGVVSLAYLLTDATLRVLYVGLGIFVAALLARGLLDVLLRSPLTAAFRSLRSARDLIRKRFNRLLDMAGIVLWLLAALNIFGILEPISDALWAVIGHDFAIGNFVISVSDLLAFSIALYLGVLISRFLRFVLQEDFYPRMRLPRGVPSTISMMVNYGVITIAFLIALAAAGFELGRLAIVAGALSVGIGFGLQAIVNNFVAGLILAFERPVQVGDTIEVGTLLGRVTRIGVRASTLRTYDGSEVIVPNSEFISGQVVNWTLSDVTKRQHVPVGVAYGSDPEQVIRLLVDVAKNNPLVLPEPEPFVIFQGFGDSSLNFELRAWCAFNDGLTVLTQLNVAINRTLAENGIEIPFPQRDLHLRSVDSEAGSALAGTGRSPGRRPDASKPATPSGSPGELPRYPAESEGSEGA